MTDTVSTTISNQVYLSRDQIRLQIIDLLKTYLELENVDLVKGSFLSFLVNTLSTLTSNLLFYNISNYREFFMTTAQLDESVLNLSAFLGYNSKEASFATANLLMTIPLTFSTYPITITLPNGSEEDADFYFNAGDVKFVTYYKTTITITSATQVNILVEQDSKMFNLPFTISDGNLIFSIPIRQYEINVQEFQVDSDLQAFQFFTQDVELDGKVSSMKVEVKGPDAAGWTQYLEYSSLYLMSSDNYGYVSRRMDTGRRLYFGNGLVGVQPQAGSTIKVTTYITDGLEGNALAGTITTGSRLYTTEGTQTKIVNYTVVNAEPAFGGDDEEDIQDIRSNTIANLVSLGRLVSEKDYSNINVVIPYSPLTSNALPILKRSDIIKNEIALFISLLFGTSLVPTRNAKLTTDLVTTYIPRKTQITVGDADYYTLFDMNVDRTNNSAEYNYFMTGLDLVPALETTYSSAYSVSVNKVSIENVDTTANFVLSYIYSGLDPSTLTATMGITKTGRTYDMTNDSTSSWFVYDFIPNTDFPEGDTKVTFDLYASGVHVSTYSCSVTIRKSLKDFMMSNIVSDSTSTIIYDIPVIQKTYYDGIDQKAFELQVIQYLMSSLDFPNYRMLTDFVNVKFTNTIGQMNGMTYNLISKSAVKQIGIPSPPVHGESYIVTGLEGSEWVQYRNKIATYDATAVVHWSFVTPVMDDIVYVESESKRYIYTGIIWMYPQYDIPLEIELEVFKKSTYYGSDIDLASAVRSMLYAAFSERFGSNIAIYRSEIIEIVHLVEGVRNCNLIRPESNIFFDFTLDTLTNQQLLEYGPEYVYFNESNVTVRIL